MNKIKQASNVEIKVLTVNIPKFSKIKTANNSDFLGFTENLNKNQKKDLLENNARRPLIIINPIFDLESSSSLHPHEAEQNRNGAVPNSTETNTNNDSDHFGSFVNRRNNNVSDKMSIGFIV